MKNKGNRRDFPSNRPVTRSYLRDHNNLVSEPVVMGDLEILAIKLDAFMEQMAARQRALEEQVAELSISFRGKGNGSGKDKAEVQESEIGGCSRSSGRGDKSDSQSGGYMVPRYSKMEFPTYDGTNDPLGWLKRCEKFFINQRTAEGDKVGLAAFHLLGEAQLWFDQVEQEEAELNWGRFRECCHIRFGPPLSNNPLGELANLNQTESVEDYQRQFQSLLARTSDLTPRQQVNLFTAGLKEELRIDIEFQQPGNLGIAMNLARALERKQRVSQGTLTSRANMSGPTTKPYNNEIVACVNRNSVVQDNNFESASNIGSKMVAPPIKLLSKAEMSERRARGQCFNCDALYSPGHKCKRLFCLLLYDPEEEGTFESEC